MNATNKEQASEVAAAAAKKAAAKKAAAKKAAAKKAAAAAAQTTVLSNADKTRKIKTVVGLAVDTIKAREKGLLHNYGRIKTEIEEGKIRGVEAIQFTEGIKFLGTNYAGLTSLMTVSELLQRRREFEKSGLPNYSLSLVKTLLGRLATITVNGGVRVLVKDGVAIHKLIVAEKFTLSSITTFAKLTHSVHSQKSIEAAIIKAAELGVIFHQSDVSDMVRKVKETKASKSEIEARAKAQELIDANLKLQRQNEQLLKDLQAIKKASVAA